MQKREEQLFGAENGINFSVERKKKELREEIETMPTKVILILIFYIVHSSPHEAYYTLIEKLGASVKTCEGVAHVSTMYGTDL